MAAIEKDWPRMFFILGAALFVDGVDGWMARRLDVAQRLPRWSGDVLDLVVDYLTYVFIPAFVVVWSGLLPPLAAIPCAIAIMLSGALYFADTRDEDEGQLLSRLSGGVERAGVLSAVAQARSVDRGRGRCAAGGGDVPPGSFRASVTGRARRMLTIALLGIWSVLALIALMRDMMPGPWITAALCAIALYFLGAGFLRRAE